MPKHAQMLSLSDTKFFQQTEVPHSILLDQSKRMKCLNFNLPGTYLIKQYIGGQAVNTLKVIVVSKEDLSLSVENIKYGDKHISDSALLGNRQDLSQVL